MVRGSRVWPVFLFFFFFFFKVGVGGGGGAAAGGGVFFFLFFIIPLRRPPHAVFGGLISISGRWMLSYKELNMVGDRPYITMGLM